MDLIEKMTDSQLIFDGYVVHLYKDTVQLPDGKTGYREYVKHVGAVCVVPVTDEGEVLLERQFRYAVDQVLTEIPAGKLDYPGEDWAEAALRELREETGAVPRELIDMGDYYGSPAIMGERIRMFLAKGLTFTENDLDEDEFLEVFRMPLDEAVKAVLKGEIPDGKTQCGILRAAMMLQTEA
ncbi:MAG: NUDIX hydrolase [Clostridia bacterium]|nr:NUDIX hydrolase [Clostridia bacterium]